jgi:hypothetical protein
MPANVARRVLRAALLVSAFVPRPLLAQSAPAPPPYSLPWLLRPSAPANVVRFDATYARFENAAGSAGDTFVMSFIATRRLGERTAPLFRVALVENDPPGAAARGSALSNPLLGMNYARPVRAPWRLTLFGATTLPVGSGGGDDPSASTAAAVAAAIPARSAMDNALFAVNYWTLIGGFGAARVTPGLTLQAEATVLQLTRVRGPETQDASRTNFTAGLHAGRFLGSRFSIGAELRYQRWLTNAAPVRAHPHARETLTLGVGPRLHVRLGRQVLRPGVSWSRALDDPLKAQRYGIWQLDVPVAF